MHLPLALEACAFSLALFWYGMRGGAMALVAAAGIASFVYFRRLFGSEDFLASFIALLFISFLFVRHAGVSVHAAPVAATALLFGILFFALVGVKRIAFVRRAPLYGGLESALGFLLFLGFFIRRTEWFWLLSLILAVLLYALFKESLRFWLREASDAPPLSSHKIRIFSLVGAFGLLQVAWALALLPLTPLNAAVAASTPAFVLNQSMQNHLRGTLHRRSALLGLTTLILVVGAVFAVSEWGL